MLPKARASFRICRNDEIGPPHLNVSGVIIQQRNRLFSLLTWKNKDYRLVFQTLFLPLQPKQKGGYCNTQEKEEKLHN